MRKKDIGMALACMALGVVLCGTAVPARAVEPPSSEAVQASALRVSSYKGGALSVGDRSMVVVSPYGTNVTAMSSNPGVIALEQVGGFYVMVVKSAGTAVVSVTDDAGNTASMTMTAGGAESSPTPPPAESSCPAQAPESSDPVVNSEWSHNPDTDLTANMEIRQEMVRLINQVRQEHGLVQMLLPQLHDGRAAVNGLFNLAEEGVLVRRPGPVGDGIEPQTLSDDVHAGILLVKNRGYAAYGISAVLRDYFPTLA